MKKFAWGVCVAGSWLCCCLPVQAAGAPDGAGQAVAGSGESVKQAAAENTADPRIKYGHQNAFTENNNLSGIDTSGWKSGKVHFYVSLD